MLDRAPLDVDEPGDADARPSVGGAPSIAAPRCATTSSARARPHPSGAGLGRPRRTCARTRRPSSTSTPSVLVAPMSRPIARSTRHRSHPASPQHVGHGRRAGLGPAARADPRRRSSAGPGQPHSTTTAAGARDRGEQGLDAGLPVRVADLDDSGAVRQRSVDRRCHARVGRAVPRARRRPRWCRASRRSTTRAPAQEGSSPRRSPTAPRPRPVRLCVASAGSQAAAAVAGGRLRSPPRPAAPRRGGRPRTARRARPGPRAPARRRPCRRRGRAGRRRRRATAPRPRGCRARRTRRPCRARR